MPDHAENIKTIIDTIGKAPSFDIGVCVERLLDQVQNVDDIKFLNLPFKKTASSGTSINNVNCSGLITKVANQATARGLAYLDGNSDPKNFRSVVDGVGPRIPFLNHRI